MRLLSLLIILVVVHASPAASQNDPCDPRALLPPTDPAHTEAMELARTLNRRGIQVRCVLLSKEAQMFEGQLGAALFRTDRGDFEALFLPRSQSWDEMKVVQQREAGGYAKYQFQGSPKYSGTWEGKPIYFVKHRNQFLHSLDQQLVMRLRDALQRE